MGLDGRDVCRPIYKLRWGHIKSQYNRYSDFLSFIYSLFPRSTFVRKNI